MQRNGSAQHVPPSAVPAVIWRSRIPAAVTRGVDTFGMLLGCLLIAAVLTNCANVVSRYIFSRAILGAEEVQVFILVWVVFIGIAAVAWRGEHLRMDVLVQHAPQGLRKALDRAEALLTAALALFMLYQSWHFTKLMIDISRNSDALGIPMSVPHLGLVTGFALLSAVSLLRLSGLRGAPSEVAES